jgi:hypothetical protein
MQNVGSKAHRKTRSPRVRPPLSSLLPRYTSVPEECPGYARREIYTYVFVSACVRLGVYGGARTAKLYTYCIHIYMYVEIRK